MYVTEYEHLISSRSKDMFKKQVDFFCRQKKLKGVLHVLNFKDEIAMGSWEDRSPRSELRFQ